MKYLLYTITLVSMVFSVNAASDNAALNPSNDIVCPGLCCDLPCYINLISRIIFPLTALAFVGAWIYAGFLRITAAGNPEKVKKSNQILTNSIIGFVIIALTGVIVNTMCALLGVQCF